MNTLLSTRKAKRGLTQYEIISSRLALVVAKGMMKDFH